MPTDDRRILENVIFRELHRRQDVERLLFVGVSEYTAWYHELFRFKRGFVFDTVDPAPDAAQYGAPGHRVLGFESLAEGPGAAAGYDVVVLNGVFDYGIDGPDAQRAAVSAAARLLRPRGLLVLGVGGAPSAGFDQGVLEGLPFDPVAVPGFTTALVDASSPNGHTFAAFETRGFETQDLEPALRPSAGSRLEGEE